MKRERISAGEKRRRENKYKLKMDAKAKNKEITCPYCGGSVVTRVMHDVLGNGDHTTKVYACINYPRCDSYVRAIGSLPVTLADKDLRKARQRAHYFMDKVISLGIMTPRRMYQDLKLFLPGREPHLSVLRKSDCDAVAVRYRNLLTNHDLYKALSQEELEKLYEPTPKFYKIVLKNDSGSMKEFYLKNGVTVRSGQELLNIFKSNLEEVISPGTEKKIAGTLIETMKNLEPGNWSQVSSLEYELAEKGERHGSEENA